MTDRQKILLAILVLLLMGYLYLPPAIRTGISRGSTIDLTDAPNTTTTNAAHAAASGMHANERPGHLPRPSSSLPLLS
jgi:hypothetical protein